MWEERTTQVDGRSRFDLLNGTMAVVWHQLIFSITTFLIFIILISWIKCQSWIKCHLNVWLWEKIPKILYHLRHKKRFPTIDVLFFFRRPLCAKTIHDMFPRGYGMHYLKPRRFMYYLCWDDKTFAVPLLFRRTRL